MAAKNFRIKTGPNDDGNQGVVEGDFYFGHADEEPELHLTLTDHGFEGEELVACVLPNLEATKALRDYLNDVLAVWEAK